MVSWNSLIPGYATNGFGSEDLQLFRKNQLDGIEMDVFSWNEIGQFSLRIDINLFLVREWYQYEL